MVVFIFVRFRLCILANSSPQRYKRCGHPRLGIEAMQGYSVVWDDYSSCGNVDWGTTGGLGTSLRRFRTVYTAKLRQCPLKLTLDFPQLLLSINENRLDLWIQ